VPGSSGCNKGVIACNSMRTSLFTMVLFGWATALLGQNAPAPLACDGHLATVRVSEIKAGGSVDGFLAAVAAHKAWYASHGVQGDQIFATRISIRDEKTRARSYSDKQLMTFHIHGSTQPGPKHDEAYDAFVKLYRDNSDIKSEHDICMPNLPVK
jgi:hypothetical protein